MDAEKIKEEIINLYKSGYTKSAIGKILKEKYQVYDIRTIFGKRLGKLLKEWGFEEKIPEDLIYIFRKINRMIIHLESNKKDMITKKKLEEWEKRAQSLIKYYIKVGKLPKDFRYSRDIVKLYGST